MPHSDPIRQYPSARPIVQQAAEIARYEKEAAEREALRQLLHELKDALDSADPNPKFDVATLDPVVWVTLRYEPGRYRYAIYTTDAAGTKVQVTALGTTWTIQTTGPGWVPLDLPAGTRLMSGDANRHTIITRASNLKV